VYKRMIQLAVLFGVLSIPTFASAEGGLLGSVIKQPSDIVNTVTEEVTDTTTQVEEVLPIETDQGESIKPVTKIVETVNETTQKVTETVTEDQPIVEVNVTKEPSIKVNASVIKAEVSKTPKVKVDTPIAEVNVSDTVKVDVADTVKSEADAEDVQVEVSIPQTSKKLPVGADKAESSEPSTTVNEMPATDIPEVIVEEQLEDALPIQVEVKVKPESMPQPVIGETIQEAEVTPQSTENSLEVESSNDVAGNIVPISIPMREPTKYEQLKVIPTFQSSPSTPTGPSGAVGALTIALLDNQILTEPNETLAFHGMSRTFFDQWLNAPPSQPPQKTPFTIS